jgi:CTP:molybdopterin cytidylyltransferase MocA
MRAVKIAAIVLAAGASRRLGRPKQEVILGGETLLARSVRIAREAQLAPVVVVTRPPFAYEFASDEVRVALNAEAAEGIASSIRRGVDALGPLNLAGAVLLACDQPGLSAAHLARLTEDPSRLTASAYAGTFGVPAYFPKSFFAALHRLRGDTGARSLLKDAHVISAEELQLDVDTDADLQAARALFEHAKGRP